ncbi:MAG: L-threonylcarbamoyladenylate synthase, partial [bacterium]
MTARIEKPQQPYDRDPAVLEAAALIRAGELVAFPTETVYGLGADATNREAVDAIYRVKHRPPDNPAIIHIGHNEDILRIGVVEDPRILALFKRFWPGALTMVIPALEPYRSTVGRGLDTVAVRMPGHPIALALIHAAGVPIAAPSANRSGRPSPTTAQHVFDDLGDMIPLILDGGPCMVGIESTVVDLSQGETRILRPGVITAEAISQVLGRPVEVASAEDLARSPGTRHPHYRPRVPVVIVPRGATRDDIVKQIAALDTAAGKH